MKKSFLIIIFLSLWPSCYGMEANTEKEKVILKEYKDYKCKRITIFINEKPSNQDDGIFINFSKALYQQASPIIVLKPLLRMLFDIPEKLLLLQNWNIFSKNGTGNDIYYLLIPKIAQTFSLQNLGFNPNLKSCLFNLAEDISQEEIPLDKINDFFYPKESFFKKKSGPWNIYIDGHGLTNSFIAGMPSKTFKQFLDFLSKKVITNFLFYNTCFGGGINLITPYIDKNINFTIAQEAVTENLSYGFSDDSLKPNFNLLTFFENLESIFNNEPESFKKWTEIFRAIINANYLTSNEPLIRFPGTDFFQAYKFSDKVEILTQTQMKAKALEQDSLNITDNKEILLLYPPIIPIPVKFPSNDNFKIISMNPEKALHFFKEIDGGNFKSYKESLIRPFEAEQGTKIFIIKKWKFDNGYEFSNIIILTSFNQIIITFKITQTPQVKDLYKKIFLQKEPYNQFEISKRSFKKNSIDNLNIYASYKPLLKNSQGKLLAPWQEEPSVLAAFAKQELGLKKISTKKIAAKVEEAKTRFFYNTEKVNKLKDVLREKREKAKKDVYISPRASKTTATPFAPRQVTVPEIPYEAPEE